MYKGVEGRMRELRYFRTKTTQIEWPKGRLWTKRIEDTRFCHIVQSWIIGRRGDLTVRYL